MHSLERFAIVLSVAVAALFGVQPARAGEDPLESFNRAVHEFNATYYGSASQGANRFFTDYMPDPVRKGIANFFSNLGEPVTAASSLAQGDVENAGVAAKRFVYNLTLGFGGVVDRASEMGVHAKPASVGQVFCTYGVPEGPLLVLPFYGPATVADFFGSALPVLAGYVTLGEAFWIYRASSRVASYMDDPNAPAPAEGAAAEGAAAEARPVASPGAGDPASEQGYREMLARYTAARTAACNAHKSDIGTAAAPPPVETPSAEAVQQGTATAS